MVAHCTYNVISRLYKALLIVLLLSSTSGNVLSSQEIVTYTQIEKGQTTDGYESMISDGMGHYYVGMSGGTASPGYVIGDTLITAFRNDANNPDLYIIHDFYYLKFNQDYNVIGSFVIDNAEFIIDYHATPSRSLISMTLVDYSQEDSLYPITLNGEDVIERDYRRGQGVLISLDDTLGLEKVHYPTTGMLWQVAGVGDYALMEIRIPDYEPYILIGSDTVYNHKYPEGGGPGGYEYGRQTIVLCKYDLVNEQAVWWRRIGSTGDDKLYDMEIDAFGDLVIFGTTSSGHFRFDDDYIVENMSPNKPFIGKYSLAGDLIWGKINKNQRSEGHFDISLDEMGNIYQLGYYWTPEYKIDDTILHNLLGEHSFVYRSFIIKYNRYGEYQWIRQLEGAFEESELQDAVRSPDGLVLLSGLFRYGELQLQGTVYHHEVGKRNAFIYALDVNNGSEVSHMFTEGTGYRSFANMIVDKDNYLNTYLLWTGTDTLSNVLLSSAMGIRSGFLIKFTTDFPSSVVEMSEQYSDLLIYPNPVSSGESIFIDISDARNNNSFEYSIYNSAGVDVDSGKSRFINGSATVNLNHLPSGLYWISITQNRTVKVESFVVH